MNIVIIFPYWKIPNNVGSFRVRRFAESLISQDHNVSIYFSSSLNSVQHNNKIVEVSVKNYIEIITSVQLKISKKIKTRLFLKIWYGITKYLIPVDKYLPWGLSLIFRKKYHAIIKSSDLIITSSPPNSSHIVGKYLSNKYKIPHFVDMRDGWLDEPLVTRLNKQGLNYLIESRLEKKILNNAWRISVTSEVWKDFLTRRFPNFTNKIKLITNAYPDFEFDKYDPKTIENCRLTLMYTGRFGNSSYLRKPEILIDLFYQVLKLVNHNVDLTLVCELSRKEKKIVYGWIEKFECIGVRLIIEDYLPREEMFRKLQSSDGLILISASKGPLPSKLFEYIKSKKPILAITKKESAVWLLAEKLPQMFLIDYSELNIDFQTFNNYLEACNTKEYEYRIPKNFEPVEVNKIFIDEISKLSSDHSNSDG